jgi:autotransporter-associated beta strand protein
MLVNNGGVVNLLAGTQTIGVAEGFYLGHGGSTGTLNISGGTWQQNTYMRLGVFASGNGIINQSGGTFEMAGADAGGSFEAWGDSPSAYNLQGGTFRVMTNGVQINTYSGGAMTFNITGSSGNVTMDMPYDFTAPNSSVFNNSAATLTKTGTGTLTFGNASLLDIRNGALDLQTGTIETASTLAIGSSGGTASATMTDGTLRTGYLGLANFTVGFGGTGSLTQSNGAVDVGSQANTIIGWNADGTGTYTLNGGTYSAVTNNTFIGFSGGTGTVNVNGGSFAAHNLLVGGNDAASGTLNLNGGTLSLANPDGFYVDSNGTLNLNSGGSLPAANLRVTSGGNLNFNGGAGNEVLNIFAGGGAGGTVDVNGQTLGAGSWANLIASGTGAVLRNSSGNATIAAANTIWIWDGGTSLTIDASGGDVQIDSRITSSGQTTPTGIIKTGANNLVLTYANDYTGITAINEGRVALANGNALGSTSGGTIVASGAQLLLTNVVVVAEPLTISGNGLSSGQAIAGALRSFGTNTYQGKITLGANAKIFGGSGTSLAVDVASGDAVDLSGNTLTIDGAGSLLINDGITGAGGLTKEGSGVATFAGVNTYTGTTTVSLGTLVVSNVSLSATISSDSVAVAFASAPSAGTTYTVLPGPLAANSLVSPSVTGLGSGQTAIVTNDPNLVVKVSAANGYSSWLNGQPTNSANQLAYAIGGATSPTATNGVASVTTVTSNTLSITAIVRTNDPNLAVYGQSILDLAVGTWTTNDVTNSVPVDQSGATPGTTQKQTFTTPYATNNAKKFLRLQTTLSSQ